jgi:hypothetical protein
MTGLTTHVYVPTQSVRLQSSLQVLISRVDTPPLQLVHVRVMRSEVDLHGIERGARPRHRTGRGEVIKRVRTFRCWTRRGHLGIGSLLELETEGVLLVCHG